MRKGFIFKQNYCVACGACSAACLLENSWKVKPRTIFTYNKEVSLSLPVLNLSMACNHCEEAACMSGCPANAISRDLTTGAVLIDEKKCLGCSYCLWNCPYDAPKQDISNGTFGKCNLCLTLIREGGLPACVTACPTGALGFGIIDEKTENTKPDWFPKKDLKPSIQILHDTNKKPLKIIPEGIFDSETRSPGTVERNITGEWSLIAFSFLSMLSVSLMLNFFISGRYTGIPGFVALLCIAGILSAFHLGRKDRAWRAALNILHSPLSREIVLYLAFILSSISALVFQNPTLTALASVTGLLFLLAIDEVYTRVDNRRKIYFHNGGTFLSALLITSFFAGLTIPFIFISLLKAASLIIYFKRYNGHTVLFGLRFFRLAVLFFTGIAMYTGTAPADKLISFLFLSAELADRIMFYIDFEPVNISNLITRHISRSHNEKKDN